MPFIIVIMLAAVVYLLQRHYFKRHWGKELSANIKYNKSCAEVGESLELIEEVENRKSLPVPILYLKYKTAGSFQFSEQDNGALSDYYYRNDIFSILGNQHIIRKLHFKPLKRGYFAIDSYNLVSNDLFIRQTFARTDSNFTELFVYPKRLSDNTSIKLAKTIIGDIETNSLYEDPLSFKGIRDYTRGDEIRRINWKATAKHDSLMVNTYFDALDRDVTLILNFDTEERYRLDRMQEQIIRVAATLVSSLIHRGFHVGCISNAPLCQTGDLLFIERGAGASHLHTLLKGLASIDISGKLLELSVLLEDDKFVKNSLSRGNCLLLSNYCRTDLLNYVSEKQKIGYSLSFVYIDTKEGFLNNKHYVNHPVSKLYRWEVNINEAQSNVV